MPIEIRSLASGEEALLINAAPDVFDNRVDPAFAREFLADPRHHIVAALDNGRIVGFASAVNYLHPDKAPELWINEVGVAPPWQRRGIGRRLMEAILAVGAARGCREAWVLTENGNRAARGLYAAAGGSESPDGPMLITFATGDDGG